MREQLALLPGYLSGHLRLTLLALALGVLCSMPLGISVTRARRAEQLVLALVSVIQTVPSLALLAFLVPALALIGAPSIGFLPALIGLFLYSLLPVLRNTVVGIAGVDPALIEAAQGVGMTPLQQLMRVELPLALPSIMAGIRTAAVWTVGTATLATPVGATSLGSFIFSGLQTRSYAAVLTGCLASAALALLLDGLVRLVEQGLVKRRPRRLALGLVGIGGLLVLCVSPELVRSRGLTAARRPIAVGAKTFTEQYILSRILAAHIEARTGLPARTLESLGSTVAYDALRRAQLDVYVDYSGTLWATVMRRSGQAPGRAAVLREVREYLRTQGVLLVAPLGFENTYALAMRRSDATRLGVRTITELSPHAPRLRVGSDYELFQRPEWQQLVTTYGLRFAEQRSMDPALMYEAARTGQVDVLGAFSSDGRITSYDLVVLDDERQAMPPYDAVILARAGLQEEHPEVVGALAELAGAIPAATMRELNAAVDQAHESPRAVAERFLTAWRRHQHEQATLP